MDKEIPKIDTTTKQTFRSKSTGECYDSKELFLKNHSIEDLATDTTITVTNKGLELLQKVMGRK
jgi:hypothetical protein